jgi:hypothetical protein
LDLSTVFTNIATHASAAAVAVDTLWSDVEITAPLPRGRCVRLFYAGEARPEHYQEANTLSTRLVAQVVIVRAFLPVADYAKLRRKNLMLDMAAFVKGLRTRLMADMTLGGACTSLHIPDTQVDDILFGQAHYAISDTAVHVEYDEFTWSA